MGVFEVEESRDPRQHPQDILLVAQSLS